MVTQTPPPVAFFDMSALKGFSDDNVKHMLRVLIDKLGPSRCGPIGISNEDGKGEYFLVFYTREAADLFEKIHRATGRVPRRTPAPPPGSLLFPLSDAVIFEVMVIVNSTTTEYMNPN